MEIALLRAAGPLIAVLAGGLGGCIGLAGRPKEKRNLILTAVICAVSGFAWVLAYHIAVHPPIAIYNSELMLIAALTVAHGFIVITALTR